MCGIVGVSDNRNAAQLAYLGLFALQHRGQEAAGIVVADGHRVAGRTALGLVAEAFPESVLKTLKGRSAVGHVRYATAGDGDLKNAQPLIFDSVHGPIAIAHNGTLTNALSLRRKLEKRGAIFRTSTDSEVIIHLIARHPGPVEDAVIDALRQVEGAYSVLFQTPTKIIAARDPRGFRPLIIGRLNRSHVFASETTALHQIGARVVRELEPGEIAIVENGHLKTLHPFPAETPSQCVFEQVYFARPDSVQFGKPIMEARRDLGRELAKELAGKVKADMVVPVPDSGVPAALGFAQESGIHLELGFVRSHYIGRTFLQPAQVLRDNAVKLKLSPVRELLKGKKIVLIDDSIVRGTTSRRICASLRAIGVKEIHMAISSPAIISPCYYGIDTPSKSELIAATRSLDGIRRFLGVDSLHYLSVEGLLHAVGEKNIEKPSFCTACFTGNYPTPIVDFMIGQASRKGDFSPTIDGKDTEPQHKTVKR
ncbi:MAG: amidophosphoribosyltransferase [Elusimicrobia bacterium]|nr:MAG: amidophosphoribosyltransferase [Elusimicrobiota bacterium]